MTAKSQQVGQRFQELKGLAELRLKDLRGSGRRLSARANRLSKRSVRLRTVVILLGALVATRAVADQLMIGYEEGLLRASIIIGYTMVGLLISAAAGLEAAFEYTRKAIELRVLASKAASLSRRYMSDILVQADPGVEAETAMTALSELIDDQNRQLSEIYTEAARLGLDLARESTIDYSVVTTGTGAA